MNIAQTIVYLYPEAKPFIDFVIQDDSDGSGPYIAAWNLPDPQPTEADLQAAWDELQALPPPPEPVTPEQRITALEAEKEALRAEMGAKDRENKMALFEIYSMLMGGE
jgi:ATP-dependent Clp protease ATP-binding subunit ClpA